MPLVPETIEIRLPKSKIAGNAIAIKWSNSRETAHSSFTLRMGCPCAACQKLHDPNPNVVRGPTGVSPRVEVISFDWVGNYALNFLFNDGHNSGIYNYNRILELDESTNGV